MIVFFITVLILLLIFLFVFRVRPKTTTGKNRGLDDRVKYPICYSSMCINSNNIPRFANDDCDYGFTNIDVTNYFKTLNVGDMCYHRRIYNGYMFPGNEGYLVGDRDSLRSKDNTKALYSISNNSAFIGNVLTGGNDLYDNSIWKSPALGQNGTLVLVLKYQVIDGNTKLTGLTLRRAMPVFPDTMKAEMTALVHKVASGADSSAPVGVKVWDVSFSPTDFLQLGNDGILRAYTYAGACTWTLNGTCTQCSNFSGIGRSSECGTQSIGCRYCCKTGTCNSFPLPPGAGQP